MPSETRPRVTPQLAVGFCLLLFGVLLTLDCLDVVAAAESFRFWPVLLVVLGAGVFAAARDGSGRAWGFVLALVGAWLLLNMLGVVRVRFWELFWPLAIIAVGASLIMQAFGRGGLPSGLQPSEWTIVKPAAFPGT